MNARAKQVRRDAYHLSKANGGYHYGGTFSCTDILISLYDNVLKENDKFILSKGHGCWSYYVLLRELGYDPSLGGHPQLDLANGVHWTTGSEGHGFPAGIGMAMAKKMFHDPGRVFVLMGDGECQEGTTWESLLIAGAKKLDNLCVIVDNNGIQGSGYVRDILPITPPLAAAAEAAGWEVLTIDGHDPVALDAFLSPLTTPLLVIANTTKGKGVSFMENVPCWHAKWPDEEQEKKILEELA
jgi:transketolase